MSKRRHNLGTKRFKEKSLFIFHARIALKSLILLFVRLIARGARIGKTHTQRQTHRQTHRQNEKHKHRVVVTDFRLHHTCSIIILWLHSLSGVIRSLLCNPHAFSPAIIIKWVELARNRNKWLGRTRHPYICAVHARYHARTCAQMRKRCRIVT